MSGTSLLRKCAKKASTSCSIRKSRLSRKTENRFIATTDQGHHLEADLVLYATGRSPNSAGLGLEALGVELDAKGAIKVNEGYQTNIPSIYALGDVTDRLNLIRGSYCRSDGAG